MGETRRLTIMLSGGLGDCLLASAFVRYFQESGRYDHIRCAVPKSAAELYDYNPRLSRLVACPGNDLWFWGLPEEGADVFAPYARVHPPASGGGGAEPPFRVEHLFHLNQGSEPVWRQVALHHRLNVTDGSPEVFTRAADEAWADEVMRPWRGRPRVLVNYRTPLAEKEYPLARWQAVVDQLRSESVVLELGQAASLLHGTKVVHPWPGLRQFAALIRRCDCVVSIDSFPAHLAATVGTPSVVLFGPTNPAVWGHPTSRCLRASQCPVCADTPRLRQCKRRLCMEEIAPESVVHEAMGLLSGREVPVPPENGAGGSRAQGPVHTIAGITPREAGMARLSPVDVLQLERREC
jgi:ADP-heptose:LPS heptosyltransferase